MRGIFRGNDVVRRCVAAHCAGALGKSHSLADFKQVRHRVSTVVRDWLSIRIRRHDKEVKVFLKKNTMAHAKRALMTT